MLSPGLTLLPRAAENWTDLGTHQEPPPALQGNLLSVVDVPYGFGETAPWPRSPPSCCRSRGIPLSPSFSRNCLGMPGTACSLLAGWEHLPFPRLPRKTPQQRGAKRNPGDSDPAWSKPMGERRQSGTGDTGGSPVHPACTGWGHCAAGGVSL